MKKTILFVDDEHILLDAAERILGEWFVVLIAGNGEEALRLLNEERVDCVVLDLVLPGMDGVTLLRSLRERGSDVPVIVVTGWSKLEYAEKCADLGVSGYLNKPYEFEELRDRVKKLTDLNSKGQAGTLDGSVHPKLHEAIEYIHNNFAGTVTTTRVAQEIGISSDYLGRLFQRTIGETLTGYLNRIRVEEAKRLLESTDNPVSAIMEKTGFKTEQHFFSLFKRYAGATPKSFRK